jgi:hypothetical protein
MGAPGRPGHPLLARGSWGEVRRDETLLLHAICWLSGRFEACGQLD